MPTGAVLSFRTNLWDKPTDPKQLGKKRPTKEHVAVDVQKKYRDAKKRACHNWSIVRKAFNAARFWKRMAMTASASNQSGVDLGSLKQFVDRRKLKDVDVVWTAEQEKLEKEKQEAFQAKRAANVFNRMKETVGTSFDGEITLPPRPRTVPTGKHGGPRRAVARIGNALNVTRIASPRNLQLSQMLQRDPAELAWERTEGFLAGGLPPFSSQSASADTRLRMHGIFHETTRTWKVGTGATDEIGRPYTAPVKSNVAKSVMSARGERKTGFTVGMFGGTVVKPRGEVHPLLNAIEGMQRHEETFQHATSESGVLSQRLDELRWDELRKGYWTNSPEKGKAAENDVSPVKQQERRQGGGALDAPGRQLLALGIAQSAQKAGIKNIHGNSEQMDRLIHIMDPERTGIVSPEVFAPLFFWLGLTRRRAAVLKTLELAFGSGDVDVGSIQNLSRYAEVQIRLIEGLRHLARRESLEQLCEYITDMVRLRTWFHTMKRDTTGRADIVEVQNLFARMEVTSDRQTLFRFLTHIIHSEALPSTTSEKGEPKQGGRLLNEEKRTFGIGDFASLLGRCAVSWCLHRTLTLIDPAENAWKDGSDGPIMVPAADLDREAEMRWVSLQRKIIISLLVNHRFWGRESATVLRSLNQPQMTTLGNQLSPEQWLSLFQRVRAQGIASTLPVGDEASDPEWLFKKVVTGSGSSGMTRR